MGASTVRIYLRVLRGAKLVVLLAVEFISWRVHYEDIYYDARRAFAHMLGAFVVYSIHGSV